VNGSEYVLCHDPKACVSNLIEKVSDLDIFIHCLCSPMIAFNDCPENRSLRADPIKNNRNDQKRIEIAVIIASPMFEVVYIT